MKCYLHYEGSPAITLLVETASLQADSSIGDLLELFIDQYGKLYPDNGLPDSHENWIIKKSESKREIKHSDLVSNRVQHMDDLELEPLIYPAEQENIKTCSVQNMSLGNELLAQAAEYRRKQVLRLARNIFHEVLQADPGNCEALMGLIDIYLNAEKGDKALFFSKMGCEFHPENLAFQLKLGKSYLSTGDGESALKELLQYAREIRKHEKPSQQEKFEIQVALCQAYQLLDQVDMAIVAVQGVLRESREYVPAISHYARLTFDLGPNQARDAMVLLLAGLVQDKDDKGIQGSLAELCQRPEGMLYLEKAAGDAWNSAAAVALLASVLRDHGALDQAIGLYSRAVELDPSNPSLMLAYIHILEVMNEHSKAFHKVVAFLKDYSTVSISGVSCSDLLALLTQAQGDISPSWEAPAPSDPTTTYIETSMYSDDDLQVLGIWFTLVKILYVRGALALIPPLLLILNKLHCQGDLHHTCIRNESAYYGCIAKIFSSSSPLPMVHSEDECVYFVGDSHCVVAGWRQLHLAGQQYRIHPILSTGTKIWHLRPESVFYPKINFFNVISQIPSGAKVIMAFGEIDCREALVKCVDSCRYESLEVAIETLCEIYRTLLQRLARDYGWNIYVHPVPPVLDITRPIVRQFNSKLKAMCQDLKYLDIDDALLDGESGMLMSQYEFDGTHLNPVYLQVVEKALEQWISA